MTTTTTRYARRTNDSGHVIYRIQPAQYGQGLAYNPRMRDPHALYVDSLTWKTTRGEGFKLLGFQKTLYVHHIDLTREEFTANPQRAVGLYPILSTAGGAFTMSVPVRSVITFTPPTTSKENAA